MLFNAIFIGNVAHLDGGSGSGGEFDDWVDQEWREWDQFVDEIRDGAGNSVDETWGGGGEIGNSVGGG
jgi:hypothetical protein